MSRRSISVLWLCALSLPVAFVPGAFGAAFASGDLVVVVDGDGVAALSSAAAAGFLREYNPFTANQVSPIQTIALPTAAAGANQALTFSGSATSEGFLTLSSDGNYLTLSGYAAAPGTAGVVTAAPTAINRVVGRIDMNGNVDTSTSLTDANNGSNIRSAVSTDGTSIWTSGNAGSGQGATAGVRATSFGTTTSTRVDSTSSNMRVVNIFNGQLYVSSSTGTLLGVSKVGSGLPTSLSSSTITLLPGMPTTGTHSSYDFWFRDSVTLYVADDGSAASGGGIQKWTFDGTTWSLAYTLLNNGTTTTAVRSLAGEVDSNGNTDLFASGGPTLLEITDTNSSAVATILATAPANTAFRGVEFLTPTPEPSTLALLGLGGVSFYAFRRRKTGK